MTAVATRSPSADVIEQVLVGGDLSKLTIPQRTEYYGNVCRSLGLNPLTKPFDYISLNGKLVLYAKRDCTDQLRSIKKISIQITCREKIEDVYIVTARAKNDEGREDESTGAVNIAGLKGDNLANAMMKAETKAKRRVTLSICGLGLLDESEIETIPQTSRAVEAEPEAPASDDSSEYKPTFGKYKGQLLNTVDIYDLAQYVAWLEQSLQNSGQQAKPNAAEFLEHAHKFLNSRMPKDSALDAMEEQ